MQVSIKRLTLYMIMISSSYLTGIVTSQAKANPNPSKTSFSIKDINAPYPKHCLDEGQWKGVEKHSPFNMFDGQKDNAWVPCAYAIKDGGYTLNIELEETIEVDALGIQRVGSSERLNLKKAKRASKNKKAQKPRQVFETIQVLFFNYAISKKYPVYFQDVKFEGQDEIKISYQGMLNWNPRLLGEPMFDERRRALKLPTQGMPLPIHVDKISLVLPSFSEENPPPAIRELSLYRKDQVYRVSHFKQSKQDYVEVMSQVYNLMVNGFMFIGEERAMVFAPTGTLWAMEGEETVAKVIGAWRFNKGRVEVDLAQAQKQRVYAKRKARLAKTRDRYFTPLHLIIDEAPDRIWIKSGPLQGEYQSVKVNSSNEAHKLDAKEIAPSFEVP